MQEERALRRRTRTSAALRKRAAYALADDGAGVHVEEREELINAVLLSALINPPALFGNRDTEMEERVRDKSRGRAAQQGGQASKQAVRGVAVMVDKTRSIAFVHSLLPHSQR